MRTKDLTGIRFDRLLVLKLASNSIPRNIKWECKCDCGNIKIIRGQHLRSGNTKSCGCLSKEVSSDRGHKSRIGERSKKHGGFGTRLYGVWAGMKNRCNNPNSKYYKDYGGRGIEVCNDWSENFENFRQWSNSNGYEKGMSLERKNVNGNYVPENCTWIPLSKQNSNKRVTIRIEYQGKFYTIKELSETTGIKSRTLQDRYYRGLPVEKIIEKVIHKNQYD